MVWCRIVNTTGQRVNWTLIKSCPSPELVGGSGFLVGFSYARYLCAQFPEDAKQNLASHAKVVSTQK